MTWCSSGTIQSKLKETPTSMLTEQLRFTFSPRIMRFEYESLILIKGLGTLETRAKNKYKKYYR